MSEVKPVAGGVLVSLGPHETSLLKELLVEMKTLLEADIPDIDPVKARLFPTAFEDEQDEAHYRELTANDLLEEKRRVLGEMQATLDEDETRALEAVLEQGQADAWLTVLTDIRLAIGTRLEVTEDKMSKDIDPGHPDAPAYAVLHWLGWLQESFLDAMR